MSYRYSALDRKNLEWFPKDTSRATLLSIEVQYGKVRGLENIRLDFLYPITAVAGRNGVGKTTILALAACAFHNKADGFRLPDRDTPYYTFSDFFVQTAGERPVSGITINYQILYDNWYSPTNPVPKEGSGKQTRVKSSGGRWNNYAKRVDRNVVYLGIDRIVPNAERSASKSYRRRFQWGAVQGWEAKVREIIRRIIGVDYVGFRYMQASKYRIPVVQTNDSRYSGFNMGAGEGSLFELFSILSTCGEGALIIIDEIELGLHEEAQARLIDELKILCQSQKFQIICTTHSPQILDSLPPEGRIFLERFGKHTQVIPKISSAYATGKLSGRPNVELDILVEDESAKSVMETCLTPELRSRSNVMPVGSAAAVMRHLAARYKEKRKPEVCVILDGDMASSLQTQINEFLNSLGSLKTPEDKEKAKRWAQERLNFLPGTKWPEHWVFTTTSNDTFSSLGNEWGLASEKVEDIFKAALRAGKHKEFYEAARKLYLDQKIVTRDLIKAAFEVSPDELKRLTDFIKKNLK